MWRAIWVAAFGCVCGISCAGAPQPAAATNQPNTAPAFSAPVAARRPVLPSPPADPPIAVGEWLVLTLPELTAPGQEWVRAVQVGADGRIPVPYCGRVAAAALTLDQVVDSISKQFSACTSAKPIIELRRSGTRPIKQAYR
jgi:protein involved in polysaccharide export with SLBB domain